MVIYYIYSSFYYTYLFTTQIFLLYNQHWFNSDPTRTTAQRHKLQHLLLFSHASTTYNHTSFCLGILTNYLPPFVISYSLVPSVLLTLDLSICRIYHHHFSPTLYVWNTLNTFYNNLSWSYCIIFLSVKPHISSLL